MLSKTPNPPNHISPLSLSWWCGIAATANKKYHYLLLLLVFSLASNPISTFILKPILSISLSY